MAKKLYVILKQVRKNRLSVKNWTARMLVFSHVDESSYLNLELLRVNYDLNYLIERWNFWEQYLFICLLLYC